MDSADIVVSHLVDYGTINFTWQDAVLVAIIYAALNAAWSFAVLLVLWLFKARAARES